MWELAGEACEAGQTPGQPGRLGVPASWVGEPEAGLGHPGEGWQAQPAPLSVVLGSPRAWGSLALEAMGCWAWALSPPWVRDRRVSAGWLPSDRGRLV